MDVTTSCRDIKQLSAQAQKACALFMERCKAAGLNVLITETYRSQERQDYLYQQGRSRPGKVVTWTRSSRHTSRRAWDICKNVKGQEYSDVSFFKRCGAIAAELGITWGGTWKSSPDTPHFEIDASWKEPVKEEQEVVKKIKMQVNGVIKQVEVIEKDGYNYAKLQDIKDHFIKVEYDSVKKLPIIEARA